ncbi:MAG: DUF1801 domain-containing protein [Bacteroidetes bacterium]|nr:DUF1801 domain-containing protein [Bacteroidota bacterium]
MRKRPDFGHSADAYFTRLDPRMQPLAFAVREVVLRALPPTAVELIKWGVPCYMLPGHAMWTCSIRAAKAHITLQFGPSGARLDDPEGLLEGTGKDLRHVKVRSEQDLRKRTLTALVKQAARIDGAEA